MFRTIVAVLLSGFISFSALAAQRDAAINQTPSVVLLDAQETPSSLFSLSSNDYPNAPFNRRSAAVELTVNGSCCKVCSKGQACGNSCISRSKVCRKPPGCACDG